MIGLKQKCYAAVRKLYRACVLLTHRVAMGGGDFWAGKRVVDRQARTYRADILLLAVILKAKSARASTGMCVTL